MNKDEKKMTIEEMARIICKETSNEGLCEKCEFKKHEQFGYTYQCHKFDDAEALYNAGYRKIGEDEIVVKKREYDILLRDYALTYNNAYQWGLKVGEEETAREILQEFSRKLKDKMAYSFIFGKSFVVEKDIDNTVNELANEHGIELE